VQNDVRLEICATLNCEVPDEENPAPCRNPPRWNVIGPAGRAARRNPSEGSIPMQYLLMIYNDEAAIKAASKAETEQVLAAYRSYIDAATKAGVLLGINRLQFTATATTVKVADGKTQVLDGPYAETKEQLGGYLLIDVPDLDTALSWAARCPGASRGTVEVRPIWQMQVAAQQQAAE
jgi:hypothetical protein